MKKIAIITLYGNHNYGNKLQNYAVQEILKKHAYKVETIKNVINLNKKDKHILRFLNYHIKKIIHIYILKDDVFTDNEYNKNTSRTSNYLLFDKYIEKSEGIFNYIKKRKYMNYDYYIVGSDQVWNPYFGLFDLGLLNGFEDSKKIAFSASIGVNNIPKKMKNNYKKYLAKFKKISVREDRGKEIIEELTGRKDVEVLVDPTMLLTSEDWDKVSKKPKQLDDIKEEKYILNYFLGELSESRKKAIEKIAEENDCYIINILDKKDPFYVSGPSEFLYLEKHAFLICTDSFHSSVFAILYNRPFVVFDRDEEGMNNMGSRIDTLLSKFKLENRRFNGKEITKENLQHDYTEAYKILEKERKKSELFLKKALDIKDSD